MLMSFDGYTLTGSISNISFINILFNINTTATVNALIDVNKMIMTQVCYTWHIFILHRIEREEWGTVEIERSGQTGASYKQDLRTSYTGQEITECHISFLPPFIDLHTGGQNAYNAIWQYRYQITKWYSVCWFRLFLVSFKPKNTHIPVWWVIPGHSSLCIHLHLCCVAWRAADGRQIPQVI